MELVAGKRENDGNILKASTLHLILRLGDGAKMCEKTSKPRHPPVLQGRGLQQRQHLRKCGNISLLVAVIFGDACHALEICRQAAEVADLSC
ncbi:origin recognition complex 1 [Perilla frutescens var. frutescens]|nr:origin recognition complex 1 [Perilla frutescens var. frutescens]